MSDLNDVSVIVAGDLNARVQYFNDFISDDNREFVFNESVDYPSDTFHDHRKNRDTEYNKYVKSLIELFCTHDIHMLNGRFGDGGHFTCTANGGTSTVDYIQAPINLFQYIVDFKVGDLDISDHFPVMCTLQLGVINDDIEAREDVIDDALHDLVTYKWNDALWQDFLETFRKDIHSLYIQLTKKTAKEH